jgi:hypothetical protein
MSTITNSTLECECPKCPNLIEFEVYEVGFYVAVPILLVILCCAGYCCYNFRKAANGQVPIATRSTASRREALSLIGGGGCRRL